MKFQNQTVPCVLGVEDDFIHGFFVQDLARPLLNVLEQTPPELYADIVNKGIYLAGGGALLRGLDKRLSDKININFNVVEDPLHAVARGTGVALKNVDKFQFLMR